VCGGRGASVPCAGGDPDPAAGAGAHNANNDADGADGGGCCLACPRWFHYPCARAAAAAGGGVAFACEGAHAACRLHHGALADVLGSIEEQFSGLW
jgi:hypothetical protein